MDPPSTSQWGKSPDRAAEWLPRRQRQTRETDQRGLTAHQSIAFEVQVVASFRSDLLQIWTGVGTHRGLGRLQLVLPGSLLVHIRLIGDLTLLVLVGYDRLESTVFRSKVQLSVDI